LNGIIKHIAKNISFRKDDGDIKKEINYITIDGRGEYESFRHCITKAIQDLKPGELIDKIIAEIQSKE